MDTDRHSFAVAFGKNLRTYRKRAAISQEELAQRASLHRTEIGLLERGERLPIIDTLVKLAAALDVWPEELLKGIDWRPTRIQSGGFELRSSGKAGKT
jgi:transcriptional regulator with XRE-family HTH domain